MKIRTLVTPLLVIAIITVACANASVIPGGGGTGSGGGGGSGGIDHPAGAGDLVLRISYEGGFAPAEYLLTATPGFSLFGDGTVVTPGAQTEIYPGPALAPLVATAVTEDGVQALLRAALEAGLGEDHEFTDLGSVGIADASTTVFTLTAKGVTQATKAYALGELGQQPDGMPDEEFAARTRLLDLQSSVQDLGATLPEGSVGDDTMFAPTGLRLFVSEYRPDKDLKEPTVDWPLATPLSSFGEPAALGGYRCGAVTGEDLDAVLALAQSANSLTPWRSRDARYAIVFRQLLPDESGC